MFLSRLSVWRRILLVLLIGAVPPAVMAVHSLIKSREALLDARASEVRHLDETAWAMVAAYHKMSVSGPHERGRREGSGKERRSRYAL